jgi:hypothetical protein
LLSPSPLKSKKSTNFQLNSLRFHETQVCLLFVI